MVERNCAEICGADERQHDRLACDEESNSRMNSEPGESALHGGPAAEARYSPHTQSKEAGGGSGSPYVISWIPKQRVSKEDEDERSHVGSLPNGAK